MIQEGKDRRPASLKYMEKMTGDGCFSTFSETTAHKTRRKQVPEKQRNLGLHI